MFAIFVDSLPAAGLLVGSSCKQRKDLTNIKNLKAQVNLLGAHTYASKDQNVSRQFANNLK